MALEVILGAKLFDDIHVPPSGIGWWEYFLDEGPPGVSPGDIPGLVPTYGWNGAVSDHHFMEQAPLEAEDPPVTRKVGESLRNWDIAHFIQVQYGIWKKDNANRAKIKEAMENRAAISTEDDPTYLFRIKVAEEQYFLDTPFTDPIDEGTSPYGHWISKYTEPRLTVSECGVSLCRDVEEVVYLGNNMVRSNRQEVVVPIEYGRIEPTRYSFTYNPYGSNPNPYGAFIDLDDYTLAYAVALARAQDMEQECIAWCASNGASYGGMTESATFHSINSRQDAVFAANTTYVRAGTYSRIHPSRCEWITYWMDGPTPRVYANMNITEVEELLNSPPTDPNLLVEDRWYFVGYGNTGGAVKARPCKIAFGFQDTNSLRLMPPATAYNPAVNTLARFRQVASCGTVAIREDGGDEIPYVCLSSPSWPVGALTACSPLAGSVPIDPDTGSMCGGGFNVGADEFPGIDWNDIWEGGSITLPEVSFLLQDGSNEPLYPTFYGAYVYDTHLKKWGKYKGEYLRLLDYQPINQDMNGLQSYAKFGILGGILAPDGSVRLFDTLPTSSSLVYGKVGYYRQGMTTTEEVIAHMRIPCTGVLKTHTSLKGKVIDTALSQSFSYTSDVIIRATGGYSGRWHNIEFTGQFDISYLEFRGIIQGKR